MTQPTPRPAGPPPLSRWLAIAGSLLIAYHLGAVGLNALAAPSGPWPTMEGADVTMPPLLVGRPHEQVALPYLRAIKMTHNYHFRSNRVGMPEAFLEVQLQNASGDVVKTVRVPDPDAPAILRARQAALARWVIEDMPVQPNMGEKIPAPNAKVPEIPIWEPVPMTDRKLALNRVPENLVPRDRPVARPSEWSLIVVRSACRYLCRVHDASQAEVVRHSKEAIPPRVLYEAQAPPDMPALQSTYGRLPR